MVDSIGWRSSAVVAALFGLAFGGCGRGGLDELRPDAGEVGELSILSSADAAPTWAIRYGGEFWRRPAQDLAATSGLASPAMDFGDVIDRVSHAIERPDAGWLPRANAITYAASFDGRGLRFSPHRPSAGSEAMTGAIADPTTELRI